MILFIPGRHHALTQFQASYLWRFFKGGLGGESDTQGQSLTGDVEAVIFAVTSADHGGTRRNPLSYAYRAMALHDMGTDLGLPLFVYPVADVAPRPDFAGYSLKSVIHEGNGRWELSPENTLVVCATPVAHLYEELGYRVWGGEAVAKSPLPWELIEAVAQSPDWRRDPYILKNLHPCSYQLFDRYALGEYLKVLWSDPVVGQDGDLTTTRDYGTYVRQMDENMDQKWRETAPFVKPGRVGDIGCAVGSWLRLASGDSRFSESEFYGIEVARPLYDICQQRRHNGEFPNPQVWFSQKNAVTGNVFRPHSMNTIHTGSLTHEIESYGGRQDLLNFITRRREELALGGVWINRDVIGPEQGDREVILEMETGAPRGSDLPKSLITPSRPGKPGDSDPTYRNNLRDWLETLSTWGRFQIFAQEFRHAEERILPWKDLGDVPGGHRVSLSYRDAAEFLLTKDYTDNWDSEMHETFCHWSLTQWKQELIDRGFQVHPDSKTWVNPWILEHRWLGKVSLYDLGGEPLDWPPTNMVLVAQV